MFSSMILPRRVKTTKELMYTRGLFSNVHKSHYVYVPRGDYTIARALPSMHLLCVLLFARACSMCTLTAVACAYGYHEEITFFM